MPSPVSHYGVGIETMLDEAVKAPCPMALHFGGADSLVPPAALAKSRAAFAEGLPVAGVESATKLLDETIPSNTLMKRWRTSAGE